MADVIIPEFQRRVSQYISGHLIKILSYSDKDRVMDDHLSNAIPREQNSLTGNLTIEPVEPYNKLYQNTVLFKQGSRQLYPKRCLYITILKTIFMTKITVQNITSPSYINCGPNKKEYGHHCMTQENLLVSWGSEQVWYC